MRVAATWVQFACNKYLDTQKEDTTELSKVRHHISVVKAKQKKTKNKKQPQQQKHYENLKSKKK